MLEMTMDTSTPQTSPNGLAITSLVLGILALGLVLLRQPNWSSCLAMLAVVTGWFALMQMKNLPRKAKWPAFVGLLLGFLTIFLYIFIIIFVMLAPVR